MKPRALALLWLVALAIAWGAVQIKKPRLIGYNCGGPHYVMTGEEESDFPYCERIERL